MGSTQSGEGILVRGGGSVKRTLVDGGWTFLSPRAGSSLRAGAFLAEANRVYPPAPEARKFAGTNSDDAGFFDEPFAGLVKASYGQIKAR